MSACFAIPSANSYSHCLCFRCYWCAWVLLWESSLPEWPSRGYSLYYGQDDVIQSNDEPHALNTKQLDRNQSDKSSLSVTAYNDQLEFSLNFTSTSNLTPTVQSNTSSCLLICRVFCMELITCLLLMCITGFALNVHSFYGLFALTSIGLILGTAYTYFTKCKRSSYTIPNS